MSSLKLTQNETTLHSQVYISTVIVVIYPSVIVISSVSRVTISSSCYFELLFNWWFTYLQFWHLTIISFLKVSHLYLIFCVLSFVLFLIFPSWYQLWPSQISNFKWIHKGKKSSRQGNTSKGSEVILEIWTLSLSVSLSLSLSHS